jgi:ketosteroid isomerase-like protein
MSQENVDLVARTIPAAELNFVELARDDEMWAAHLATVVSAFHADVTFANHGFPAGEASCVGLAAVRSLFRDWYRPWATYRTEVEQAIDCGDQVLHLTRDFGVLWDTTREITLALGCVYTIREGKIARWDVYLDRAEAFKAVGLEE